MSAPTKIYYDDFTGKVNREWMVGDTTYIREDLVGALVEALKNTTAHLIAAHNLLQHGGKKAAASNTMLEIMLNDYEKSIEVGRAALKKLEESHD